MILELGQIESFPAQIVVVSSEGGIPSNSEDVRKISSAKADLNVQKGDEEFYCQGNVTASLEIECARCLAPFDIEVKSKIDFILCDKAHLKDIAGEGHDSEDYVIFSKANLAADISTIVRQVSLLSISMKPICSEDCLGLCLKCGINLNTKSCDCRIEKADPRWDGLKELTINKH